MNSSDSTALSDAELSKLYPEWIDPDGNWNAPKAREAQAEQDPTYATLWILEGGHRDRGRATTHRDHTSTRKLNKRDGLTKLRTDEDAWLHVWTEASKGVPVCRAALLWLRNKNPTEYRRIRNHCTKQP